MAEYMVHLETTASLRVKVDVPDDTPEEEIIETAYDAALDNAPNLCVDCTGFGQGYNLDLGEWDVSKNNGIEIAPEKV